MDFKKIMLDNRGRDLYLCIEQENRERHSWLIKKYYIYKRGYDRYLIKSESTMQEVELCLGAELLFYRVKLTGLIDIEARAGDLWYHLYIADGISEESNQRLEEQINSLDTLESDGIYKAGI